MRSALRPVAPSQLLPARHMTPHPSRACALSRRPGARATRVPLPHPLGQTETASSTFIEKEELQ